MSATHVLTSADDGNGNDPMPEDQLQRPAPPRLHVNKPTPNDDFSDVQLNRTFVASFRG